MPTEDGWEPSPRIEPNSPLLVWRTVPGSDVNLQVRNDNAGRAMLAYAADYHAYVEPLVDRITACYTPTNSVSTSNHLNATAMDFNWDYYPWKKRGNLNGAKLTRLRELLDYWRGIMFWAGDWSDAYVDEMHHQMDYGSYDLERSGQLGQWVKDHIRPDGFSTYKREGVPVPPKPTVMTVPLTPLPNNRWTSPSPAWAHLITRESGGNPTIIQQITDVNSGGNEAEGLFQITPRTWRAHNGTEFSPTARSATPQQQAIVAARIFTRNPSGSDWGAGLPGREDARQLAAGLVPTTDAPPPTQGEDELSAEAERMIREMYGEWRKEKRGPSRSFLAEDGRDIESPLGFLYNIDGNVWTQQLTWAYLFDVPLALEVVESVAQKGVYSGSWASESFNAWLNEFGQAYCRGLVAFKKALVAKLALSAQQTVAVRDATPVTNVTNVVDTRALEAEIARLSERFERLQVAVNNPPVSTEVAVQDDSTGEKIRRAVDSSMDYTDHVLAMDAATRTALTRALNSIDPSNGDQA